MKNNNRKRLNLYTQVQRFAARVLLIVWMLGSGSLEDALAVSKPSPIGVAAFGALLLGGGGSFKSPEDTVALRRIVEADASASLPPECNITKFAFESGYFADPNSAKETYIDIMQDIDPEANCVDLNLGKYAIDETQFISVTYDLQHLLRNECKLYGNYQIFVNHVGRSTTNIISVSDDNVEVDPSQELSQCNPQQE